ncbi:MAG: [FeFe] hydrogenase H-cluster maturation GTPase HydF [Candidatus Bruticola sp.]
MQNTTQNNLNSTPSANRVHIGFFGRRNSGKSSLINALTGQNVSIVSQRAGTTTDPVTKPMEIKGLGPCVLIDTAGFDDDEEILGAERIQRTATASEKVELAIILISAQQWEANGNLDLEQQWAHKLTKQGAKLIWALTQIDTTSDAQIAKIDKQLAKLGIKATKVSIYQPETLQTLRQTMIKNAQKQEERTILGDLVKPGDLVVLVMPQDIQAPQGRLILPQVQTIRELLDRQCIIAATTTANLNKTLASLSKAPNLIITDSQAFKQVYASKPQESRLTSFSILFAAYKGDLNYYMQGTDKLTELDEKAHILIAECCSHAPLQEDIGRVKLPRLLRRHFGDKLNIDIVSGQDFPQDLTPYDLIIQCGACMFNRQHVLSRIARAKEQHIPMNNYGLALAYLNGLPLHECALPQHNDR